MNIEPFLHLLSCRIYPQNNLKALHLHTCLRQLGIDVIGLDTSTGDCIMRSPGLRPRHWAMICSQLPKGAAPKGLDVIFPARFSFAEDDTEITGGKTIDLEELLINPSYNDDDEEWDALDEEEVEDEDREEAVGGEMEDEVEKDASKEGQPSSATPPMFVKSPKFCVYFLPASQFTHYVF